MQFVLEIVLLLELTFGQKYEIIIKKEILW